MIEFQRRPGDFADAAKVAAGEPKAPFMDQTAIISDRYDMPGEEVVNSFSPADHILHTNTP